MTTTLRSLVLRLPALALVAALLGGCAAGLVVRHEDPYHPVADIWVDGKKAGRLRHGESTTIRLQSGAHILRVVAPGEAESPWTRPHKELRMILERRATLTLLPLPAEGS